MFYLASAANDMGMIGMADSYNHYLPRRLRDLAWRAHPLDGRLLLFERDTGLNMLLEGQETAHLQRTAPRTLLIAVTNSCNLSCPFCYCDLQSPNLWRYESLLDFCRQADEWGVLEVAFGGGEPLLFPHWQDFICELYATTRLGINFTTNGLLLTTNFLQAIAGHYGQIRLSIYKDNNWVEVIKLLQEGDARFGVNWLITPPELPEFTTKFTRLLELGVRDFLLLSYKGKDQAGHLDETGYRQLERQVGDLNARLGHTVSIKLDVCWGDTLAGIPRLFAYDDCGAGEDFLSITNDKQIKPCSFHHVATPFTTFEEVRTYWLQQRANRNAACIAGCARLTERKLHAEGGCSHADNNLARI